MLSGRVALVTGASRGLGREVAQAFVRAGANVALVARPSPAFDATLVALGAQRVQSAQRLHAIPTDLSRHEGCPAVAEAAHRALGSVDILVNNAGITGPIGALEQTHLEEWLRTIEVNLLAPIALMSAVVPHMRARGWGKIINLSGGGATGPRPNFMAYAASKAALVRATETLAEEVKGQGIDVNAVAPGIMNTRMLDDMVAAGQVRAGQREYQLAIEQQARGGSPPTRAVGLVLWLASPASNGITGRLISAVWDPWEHLASRREELAGTDIYTLRRIVPEDRGKDWPRAT